MTFRFLDFEITHNLEEISEFAELPLKGRMSVLPSSIRKKDFLRLLGLHIFPSLRNVEGGKVKLDYFFKRYGRLESYEEHRDEFDCTHRQWVYMQPRVFKVAFSRVMVFPDEISLSRHQPFANSDKHLCRAVETYLDTYDSR